MNNIILNTELKIEEMIYEIRGRQVMLDSDLAKLYEVETKRINEAVKNNPYKFPERFSWILDNYDENNLRSKISTSNITRGGRRYKIRVFTEQGVAMLATILKSKTTKEVILVTNKYNNQDYDKYKKQYENVELIINNTFHDRFIIIDKKILYHCGASFKDLGKKSFAISIIQDNNILSNILTKIY